METFKLLGEILVELAAPGGPVVCATPVLVVVRVSARVPERVWFRVADAADSDETRLSEISPIGFSPHPG